MNETWSTDETMKAFDEKETKASPVIVEGLVGGEIAEFVSVTME